VLHEIGILEPKAIADNKEHIYETPMTSCKTNNQRRSGLNAEIHVGVCVHHPEAIKAILGICNYRMC